MTDTPASWIIVDAETGRAIHETYSKRTAMRWRADPNFRAIPAAEYLGSLNKEPKE